MSLNVCSCGCGKSIVSPNQYRPSRPWVLDETLPRTRNPQEVMNEKIQQRILEQAKNKPDEDRNIFDYLILAKNKVDEMMESSIKYYA